MSHYIPRKQVLIIWELMDLLRVVYFTGGANTSIFNQDGDNLYLLLIRQTARVKLV